MEINEKVKHLKSSLFDSSLVCSGVVPVTQNDLTLYYGKGENARRANLNHPPANELDQLMNACEPTQFGRGKENVLDESYGKASELRTDAFRPMLDVGSAGLVRLISERMLGGSETNRMIRAELYNLNVYGEGSFFKAHIVDTPCGKNMFGSLVVFYPTTHEGGAVVLRKNNQEWTYDSTQVLADNDKTQIGYVAFYSDIEHEVLSVTSGHRVSITYNLYFDDVESESLPPIPLSSSLRKKSFEVELQTLLDDPDFLPKGGRLGFGLDYTSPTHTSAGNDISGLGKYLKGADADLLQIVNDFELESSFWGVISRPDWGIFACKGEIPSVEGQVLGNDTCEIDEYLSDSYNARVLFTERDENRIFPVTWVKIPDEAHWQEQPFVNFEDNSAVLEYTYHAACLVVEVGIPGDRKTPVESEEWPKKGRRETFWDSETNTYTFV